MKKYLLFTVVAVLGFACTGQKGYEIQGTVTNPDLNGNYVYLYDYAGKDAAPLDSVIVQNGSFVLTGNQPDALISTVRFADNVVRPGRAATAQNAPYSATFILENGTIAITLDSISYATGTPENDALKGFQSALRQQQNALNEVAKSLNNDNPAEAEAAEKRYIEANDRLKELVKSYISNNNNTLSGGKLLYDFRHTLNEDERRQLVQNADETFISAPGVQQVMDHLDVLNKVAIGKKFTDFEMADPKGQMHKLSEYAGNGKVVLMDFWAAWCPPCRKQMPALVELYKTYRGKDFEIVGISLDRTVEEWEKGIIDLGITWPQMGDLKYWQSEAAALYGVNSIPHLVLVGKDGTIVAKNIHGEELENTIKQELAK